MKPPTKSMVDASILSSLEGTEKGDSGVPEAPLPLSHLSEQDVGLLVGQNALW